MHIDNKRLHRVCFTGHRPEKMSFGEEEIKLLLRPVVIESVSEGYTTFITGMARGFDMWAADIVLEERKRNSDIRLICVLPVDNFEKRWYIKEQEHYRDILSKADFIKTISPYYNISCFQKRNIYMVDNSSRVIAALDGSKGGTLNTVNYAKKCGVEVINILEK